MNARASAGWFFAAFVMGGLVGKTLERMDSGNDIALLENQLRAVAAELQLERQLCDLAVEQERASRRPLAAPKQALLRLGPIRSASQCTEDPI